MERPQSHAASPAEPWYRQFWPWFIIAVPAATVIGCMVTIFLAVTRPDSLVVDDYSRIKETTERRFRMADTAAALGLQGRLTVVAGEGAVELRLQQGLGSTPMLEWPDTLLLELSHPTIPGKDLEILLTRAPMAAEGTYRARLAPIAGGERWYAAVESLGEPADGWRLTGEVSRQDGSGALTPAAPGDDG